MIWIRFPRLSGARSKEQLMFDLIWREIEAEIEGGVGRFEFKSDKMS
jgi:hypothetical protein